MIHAASLFHDDVIDEADTRRGVPSVNKVFGNKLAILAGRVGVAIQFYFLLLLLLLLFPLFFSFSFSFSFFSPLFLFSNIFSHLLFFFSILCYEPFFLPVAAAAVSHRCVELWRIFPYPSSFSRSSPDFVAKFRDVAARCTPSDAACFLRRSKHDCMASARHSALFTEYTSRDINACGRHNETKIRGRGLKSFCNQQSNRAFFRTCRVHNRTKDHVR